MSSRKLILQIPPWAVFKDGILIGGRGIQPRQQGSHVIGLKKNNDGKGSMRVELTTEKKNNFCLDFTAYL